ncbi:MAG: NUMOD4 domain-containing protein [Clostridium sp.]
MDTVKKETMFFIDMYTTAPNIEMKERALSEIESRRKELEELGAILEAIVEETNLVETVFLTVEDLKDAKVDIEFVESRLITINESETVEELEPVVEETIILNDQEKEFWRLVEEEEKKVANKPKLDVAYEIFGCDISSIPNSKAKEIGEDEYVDLETLTYQDEEIWKTIKGTKYQVSTLGRVRSSSTYEIIKPFKTNNIMAVKIDNSCLPVAGLIFSLFNKEVARDIQHIDNDITNNHILNLRKHEALVA